MSELAKMRWAFVGLPLAGIVAALTTICMYPHSLPYVRYGNVLGSGVFGALIATVFWLLLGLRSLWKAAIFTGASVAAAYLAFFSTVLARGRLFPTGHLTSGTTQFFSSVALSEHLSSR